MTTSPETIIVLIIIIIIMTNNNHELMNISRLQSGETQLSPPAGRVTEYLYMPAGIMQNTVVSL